MKEWFQTLPNPTYTRLDFIEPNLSFEFIGEKEEIFQIIVRLSIELNPSWCKEEEYEFCITITQEDRKNIIRLIEEQQIKFKTIKRLDILKEIKSFYYIRLSCQKFNGKCSFSL